MDGAKHTYDGSDEQPSRLVLTHDHMVIAGAQWACQIHFGDMLYQAADGCSNFDP